QDLKQDLRYGIRKLIQAPRFTLAVATVLALGIGANTAAFSVIDAAFLRPLPFFEPDRLVTLNNTNLPTQFRSDRPARPKTYPDFADVEALRDLFTSVTAYATGGLNLLGGSEPIRATVTYVSANFFQTLGRMPIV